MADLAVKLYDTAASLADGAEIDWERVDGALSRESDRRLLQQLRVVAGVAEVHRSRPDEAPEETAPPPLAGVGGGSWPPGPGRSGKRDRVAIGTWGHLQLLEKIGEGSFGEVYRARDTALRRDVALKLSRASEGDAAGRARRMLHEGRILACIRHQHVVTVHGVEEHDGRVGLWMELIEGETLAKIVATRGPFSAEEAALIGQDVCRALAAVHGAGLLHRDLKAQNVMREQGGRVVLMDFGTGEWQRGPRAAQARRITGTPAYMAPEVIDGAPASVQSDVYGLGVLLFFLATRRFPIEASSRDELYDKHATGERTRLREVRPDLPEPFVRAVERAIHPDPAERYASAGAFRTALAGSFTAPDPALGVSEQPDLVSRGSVRAWTRRQLALVASLGLVLALAVVAALIALGGSRGAVIGGAPLLALDPFVASAPNDQYFAMGLTAEVATDLGRATREVSVMPIESVTALRDETGDGGASEDTEGGAMLEQLDADFLVGGQASQNENGASVSVWLLRAGAVAPSWTETYTRPPTELPLLQADVVHGVLDALALVRMADASRAQASPTSDAAYRAYLEGRYQIMTQNPDAAIDRLREAIAEQPDYADAWAALARALFWQQQVDPNASREQVWEEAKGTAEHALALDPNRSEALGVLASIADQRDWNVVYANRLFRRALALAPADEDTRFHYGISLTAQGRLVQALDVIDEGIRLNPLSTRMVTSRGRLLYYMQRYEEAIQHYERALIIDPDFVPARLQLCADASTTGRLAEARAACERALEERARVLPDEASSRFDRTSNQLRAGLAHVLALSGRSMKARAMLDELQRVRESSPDAVSSPSVAMVHLSLGNPERALDWLERAVEKREGRFLTIDPRLSPLRAYPRFAKLVAQIEADMVP